MLTQTYIFGAETQLGTSVMSAIVFLSAAIARALTSTCVGSTALGKESENTAMIAVKC